MEPEADGEAKVYPSYYAYGRGIEEEGMENGQEQDAEVCVWSQENKSPECNFIQNKTETDVSILTLFPMVLFFNYLPP